MSDTWDSTDWTTGDDLTAADWNTHIEDGHERQYFPQTAEPATPPAGWAVRWLDTDGRYKIKFDDGSVVPLASP